jgi:hypothetical protein
MRKTAHEASPQQSATATIGAIMAYRPTLDRVQETGR